MADVVETVKVESMKALRAARDRVRDADIVELRLDGVRDLDVAGALAGRRRPVLVTCRPAWEGGRFDGSEEERLRILGAAIAAGAEFVDVEWKADRRTLPRGRRTAVVLSHHDSTGVPRDLKARVRAMRREAAAVVKIAVTARRLSDCLTLRDAVGRARSHVAIAMGAAGWVTRAWPAGFGSRWMYGGAAAPGQMQHARSRAALSRARRRRVRRRSTESRACRSDTRPRRRCTTRVRGARTRRGLRAVRDGRAPRGARAGRGSRGARPQRHRAAQEPRSTGAWRMTTRFAGVGAVNTLRRRGSRWTGANFDIAGFLAPLDRRRVRVRDARVVVLGAGGAARGAAWGLREARRARGSQRAPIDREARRLARAVGVETAAWPPDGGWDLLVNATPVGTWPEVTRAPIPRATRVRRGSCYDLVYNPLETALLKWARDAGARDDRRPRDARRAGGAQFEWWTGRTAPDRGRSRAPRASFFAKGS